MQKTYFGAMNPCAEEKRCSTTSCAESVYGTDDHAASSYSAVTCKAATSARRVLTKANSSSYVKLESGSPGKGFSMKRSCAPRGYHPEKLAKLHQYHEGNPYQSNADWYCDLQHCRQVAKVDSGAPFLYHPAQGMSYAGKLCEPAAHWDGQLVKYIPARQEKSEFECKKCKEKFTMPRALAVHLLSHPNKALFECRICSLLFTSEQYLTNHVVVHTL